VAIGGLSSSGQTSIIDKPISTTSLSKPNPRRGRPIYPARHFEMPIFTKLLAERKVERTPILEDQALPEGDPTIRPRFL